MTPLVDVVFLLLVFFVFTLRTHDILTGFDASHTESRREGVDVPVLRIEVREHGYRLNDRPVSLEGLQDLLGRLARHARSQAVVISCAPRSTHAALVGVLDACAAAGMEDVNLSRR
jgi:biopolymer transport protein ExbD